MSWLIPSHLFWGPLALLHSPILFLGALAAVLFIVHRANGGRARAKRPPRMIEAERIERRIETLEAILLKQERRRR